VALPGFFKGTEMPTAGWWDALWPDPAATVAGIGIAAGMEVVDLCCGDGWFTLPMAKIARYVTAIDIERTMLDAARGRLAQNGVAGCAFVEGDAYDIDRVIARPADFVFLANAFHGVPERRASPALLQIPLAHTGFSRLSIGTRGRATRRLFGADRAGRRPNCG
jgi:SAM-dependent methyltransferase